MDIERISLTREEFKATMAKASATAIEKFNEKESEKRGSKDAERELLFNLFITMITALIASEAEKSLFNKED